MASALIRLPLFEMQVTSLIPSKACKLTQGLTISASTYYPLECGIIFEASQDVRMLGIFFGKSKDFLCHILFDMEDVWPGAIIS